MDFGRGSSLADLGVLVVYAALRTDRARRGKQLVSAIGAAPVGGGYVFMLVLRSPPQWVPDRTVAHGMITIVATALMLLGRRTQG